MYFLTILLSFILILPFTGFSQESIYGSWEGKMSSNHGKYVFNLDLRPQLGNQSSIIKGVAIHDRNGDKEVIELEGVIYQDQSIYLVDLSDPYRKLKEGGTFSRLQFRCSFQNGDMILDGHWQEYDELNRYRKGRLVLRKRKSKA